VERKIATDTFDRIAPGWYNFRHWSIFRNELETLAQRWRSGRLLNLGCAHGPDFLPFAEGFDLHGVDFSGEMLRQGQKYARKFSFSPGLVIADVARLPFAAETFDWALSVATYHHLRRDGTAIALGELHRVLKPGGEAFITVWNRWQSRFWMRRKETTVPWKTGGETLYRYYYLFTYPELEGLVKRTGFRILKSFPESSYRFPLEFFSRNICLLVRKE
jgi:SAM-dependent methyltransferase